MNIDINEFAPADIDPYEPYLHGRINWDDFLSIDMVKVIGYHGKKRIHVTESVISKILKKEF